MNKIFKISFVLLVGLSINKALCVIGGLGQASKAVVKKTIVDTPRAIAEKTVKTLGGPSTVIEKKVKTVKLKEDNGLDNRKMTLKRGIDKKIEKMKEWKKNLKEVHDHVDMWIKKMENKGVAIDDMDEEEVGNITEKLIDKKIRIKRGLPSEESLMPQVKPFSS